MTTARVLGAVLVLAVGFGGSCIAQRAAAAACDAVLGKWDWFSGGVATIDSDGSVVGRRLSLCSLAQSLQSIRKPLIVLRKLLS